MPSSVVQMVLLRICEEGKEVSVCLSDFIMSDKDTDGAEPQKAEDGRPWC